MILARIFIVSLFIVYSNKYSPEQFSSELTNFTNNILNAAFIRRKYEFRVFIKVAILVVAMSAGAFCGVAPFVFGKKKASGFQKTCGENKKSSAENVKNKKPRTVGSSDGVVAMTEIRNKISCLRDLLDFSPCLGSTTLPELLKLTLCDIFQRYPEIKPVSEFKDASFHEALKIFCDSLKSLGDLWTTEKWMVKCIYDPSMRIENIELERIAVLMLEDIIPVARERLFDEMDDDDDDVVRDYSPPAKALFDSYSDTASFPGSPMTPTSVLPGSWRSSSPTLAAGKLSPIDLKRLSFHMLPHAAQDPKYSILMETIEAVQRSDCEDDDVEMIDVVIHTPIMETPSAGTDGSFIDQLVDMLPSQQVVTLPSSLLPVLPIHDRLLSVVPFPPPPPSLFTAPRNLAVAPPPPPPPLTTPNFLAVAPPPPPLTTSRNLAAATPHPLPPMALVNCPPPPPPPLPPTGTSQKASVSVPSVSSTGPPPPPPPPMSAPNGNGPALPRPPPPPMGKGSAPPPPPGAASLHIKKRASKLKRSSQMGNLYRTLKGKVEGSASPGKSSGRKGKGGAAPSPSGGKQGMADALAEMTKRSSYFMQIEEDVKTYEGVIKELKTAIGSFQTSDMAELLKFHKHIESHLEKLTDETQVLARFEEFPSKKLEAIRMASALYLKLDSIISTLQNWQIVTPVAKLLDKAEGYFSKIKVELDALERTKDEEMKRFQAQKITFDFGILVRIKELLVDVSSSCMEVALKEKRQAAAEGKNGTAKILWRAFQFAFRVYTFAGGHDDRADELTKEVAHEIETQN